MRNQHNKQSNNSNNNNNGNLSPREDSPIDGLNMDKMEK